MNRGYLTGSLCGLVVSAVGLGTLSLVAEQPAGNTPPQAPLVESPDLASGGADAAAGDTLPDVGATAGGAPAPSDSPDVTQPSQGAGAVQSDTTTPEQPQAGEVTAGLEAPQVGVNAGVSVAADTPVAPLDGTDAPVVPDGEADVVLETTTPEPPAAPEVVVVEDAPAQEEEVAVEEDAVEEVVIVADQEEAVEQDEAADLAEDDTIVAEGAADAETQEIALADIEAESGPDGETDAEETDAEASEGENDAPAMEAPVVNDSLPLTPSTDEDAGSLISLQGDQAVLPGRVPEPIIAEDVTTEATENAQPEETAPVVVAEDADAAQALASFATAFENTDNNPVMSIILVDDGSLSGAEDALAELDFPFSVALDPGLAGADEKMAAYRDAGIEVIAMAEVPAGAQPSDAEIALEAGFATLPEAVGLLDIGQAGLQTDREIATQVMARLAEDGRGFVSLSQGLNSGLRAAGEVDVPATTVYRDIDGNDQDARVIRRFLDQAAFRARQQGEVVLVGRVRADTISALVLWNTANAGGEVILAPVSAVLMGQ